MKKFLLSLILLVILPFKVEAASYKITEQLVEADILNNGDVKITELIVMDGTFNGYEKTLTYTNDLLNNDYYEYNSNIYNASSLELLSLQAKYVNNVSFETINDLDFEEMEKVVYAENGERGKYTMSTNDGGYTYRLYYRANKQRVAFKISYLLKQAVVKHLDVAEFYWNFITPNDYDDIEDVEIKVNLPAQDNSSDFRIWTHGPLAGEITKLTDNSGALAKIDYMEADEALDIRMTFNKNLITDDLQVKKTNVEALSNILKVEEERALKANNLRKELKSKRNKTIISTVMLYGAMLILGIYIYFKYGKSPKSGFYAKYNREFIDDYNVEVVDYLMNRNLTPNAMSASIMNLIYKKNIKLEEIKSTSKEKDYTFILDNENNLNSSETILVDFLFHKVGKSTNSLGKPIFTLADLKKYASGVKTCDNFVASYTKWKNDVLTIAKNEKFYLFSGVPKIIAVIVVILAFIIYSYGFKNGVDFILNKIIIFPALVFFVYCLFIFKKTEKGSLHYDKWKAFRNFLDDFGLFKLKELPEIALWERYLVYATIFGLAKKVQKDMNVKIKELNINDTIYEPTYIYLNLGDSISNSVSRAVNGAYQKQAANYANTHSSFSSGSGSGGGFSSGGGFGGGGSSGHGF